MNLTHDGDSDYPNTIDTSTHLNNETDDIIAEHVNGVTAAVIAMENVFGANPQGSQGDLVGRLSILMDSYGAIHSGLSIPSPALSNRVHFFYNTQTEKLYVYDTVGSSYVELTTATSLGAYLQAASDATITGHYTFNPSGTPGAPFLVGANATNQKVTGLNADQVDGQEAVLKIGTDHSHASTGAEGGVVSHTVLSDKGANTHAALDTFVASKGAINGIASLDANSRVVQPAITLYDGIGDRYAQSAAAANVIVARDSNKDIFDRIGAPVFGVGNTWSANNTSTSRVFVNSIAVTTGDIIFVQGHATWTAQETAQEIYGLNVSGINVSWLAQTTNSSYTGEHLNVVSGTQYTYALSGMFKVNATGTLTLSSIIYITSNTPSAITHSLGWTFIKKVA